MSKQSVNTDNNESKTANEKIPQYRHSL